MQRPIRARLAGIAAGKMRSASDVDRVALLLERGLDGPAQPAGGHTKLE